MVVKKVSEKVLSCYGLEQRKDMVFLATNDGTIDSGYAFGKTEKQAVENLTKENAI
jgi:hypothetical protein